jgi:DNA-binding LytR/AlgR family response regulator
MRQYHFFKTGKYYCKIKFSDILYIEADNKCVHIFTAKTKVCAFHSLKAVEEILPAEIFFKVHRSYIISLEHTDKFDNEFAYIKDQKIPMAEHYRDTLKSIWAIHDGRIAYLKPDDAHVDDFMPTSSSNTSN